MRFVISCCPSEFIEVFEATTRVNGIYGANDVWFIGSYLGYQSFNGLIIELFRYNMKFQNVHDMIIIKCLVPLGAVTGEPIFPILICKRPRSFT